MPKTKKNKTKDLLINLSVLFVTFVICLIFFEIALRILFSGLTVQTETSDLLTYHPVLGVGSKPNMNVVFSSKVDTKYIVRTNNLGWRDEDFEERSDKFRVHLYGDSFTYGVGADQDDIFANRLEKDYLQNTEVLNFGLIASGTGQQHIFFDKEGKNYDADAVVLAFYVGNDFLDNINEYEKRPYYELSDNILDKDNLILKNFPPPAKNYSQKELYPFPLNVHAFFSSKSYAYNFIYKRLISLEFVKNILKNTETGRKFFLYTEFAKIYLKEPPKDYELALLKTKIILDRFKTDVENLDIPFYIIIIPTKEQVQDEYWEFYANELDYEVDQIDRDKPVNDILKICEEIEANCYSLLDDFRESDEILYFDIDAHTNKLGHDIIAEKISEKFLYDVRTIQSTGS